MSRTKPLQAYTRFRYWLNGWSLTSALLALLILLPILLVLGGLLEPVSDTWAHVVEHLLSGYIANSMILIVGVGALSLLFGISSAWLVTQYKFPGRKTLRWLLIMPLSLPTYIIAYTYAGIFDLGGSLPFDILNIYCLVAILAFGLYPYVYLITRTSFAVQSSQLLQASRVLGKTPWQTFWRVALPLSRPAIIGGLGLVIMELLNDYGAVKYFGVNTFTTGIFRVWFSMGDLSAAIRLSACLLLFMVTLLLIERKARGNRSYAYKGEQPEAIIKPLKGARSILAILICLVPVLFGFLIPAGQLIIWTLETYQKVLNTLFFQTLLNSFGLSAAAALICVLVAWLIQFTNIWKPIPLMKRLSQIATVGYALPGAVIAIGVTLTALYVGGWIIQLFFEHSIWIVNTGITLLLFAYLVRFLAVGSNAVESAYQKLPGNLTEASVNLGKGSWSTLLKVHLPLLKGGLLAAALLVFVDVMKELPLTLILRPFNFDTLATKTFELANDELVAQSAPMALIIILTGWIPILILNRIMSRKEQ